MKNHLKNKTDFNTKKTQSSDHQQTTIRPTLSTAQDTRPTRITYRHNQWSQATFENTILYHRGKTITRAITHSPIVVSATPAFAVLIYYRRYKYPELFALCDTRAEALRLDAVVRRALRSQIKNTTHLNQRVINFTSYDYSIHTRRPASTLVI